MNLIILVPKVVRGYIEQFPEVYYNAYDYFNYDNRVVDERVNRGDFKEAYKGPDDLNDADYDALVCYARTLVNPVLIQYSPKVACEDALSLAIRDYRKGMYDGKINANHYNVLLQAMMMPTMPVMAGRKRKQEKEPETEKRIHPAVLKQLGLKHKEIPLKERTRRQKQIGPAIYRTKGRAVLKKSAEEPNPYMTDFLSMISELPTRDGDIIRKLVGRWDQTKQLIRDFLQDCPKEYDLDPDYVKKVQEDFKKASAILDKLRSLYSDVKDFDFEDIKTYLEPLQELIEKSRGAEETAIPEEAPHEEITEESETITEPKEGSMLKNAQQYTERLDKIADEVQPIDPNIAMQIDMVSDVIEGRREATSLKWDADEARYMANRFDYRVRSREADEPYMDNFNKSNFEQVMREKENPQSVRKASTLPPYRKMQKTEE